MMGRRPRGRTSLFGFTDPVTPGRVAVQSVPSTTLTTGLVGDGITYRVQCGGCILYTTTTLYWNDSWGIRASDLGIFTIP